MSEVRSSPSDTTRLYVNSKTGFLFIASELVRRSSPSQRIVSVALNTGAASTNLFRHTPPVNYLAWPLLHQPEMAALTQLYAGLSDDVNMKTSGSYIIPWGKISSSLRG